MPLPSQPVIQCVKCHSPIVLTLAATLQLRGCEVTCPNCRERQLYLPTLPSWPPRGAPGVDQGSD